VSYDHRQVIRLNVDFALDAHGMEFKTSTSNNYFYHFYLTKMSDNTTGLDRQKDRPTSNVIIAFLPYLIVTCVDSASDKCQN